MLYQFRQINNGIIRNLVFLVIYVNLFKVQAYSNIYTVLNPYFADEKMTGPCMQFFTPSDEASGQETSNQSTQPIKKESLHGPIMSNAFTDPFDTLDEIINKFLFGNRSKEAYLDIESFGDGDFMKISVNNDQDVPSKIFTIKNNGTNNGTRRSVIYINGTNVVDEPNKNTTGFANGTHKTYKLKNRLYWKLEPKSDSTLDPIVKSVSQYPTGEIMRAERFNNQKAVHMPNPEFMYRDRISLKITDDVMQTAVNAFFIFIYGTMNDIYNLPPDYVLKSTRTISMMRIPRDKLSATWQVIKAGKETHEITIETLEMYRPLFKYVYPHEMAHLDLNNSRILSYIGTHADLDRHQVGAVASHYIKLNPHWKQAKFLNLMNNVLCGVPMPEMRSMENSVYLQLNHQSDRSRAACGRLDGGGVLVVECHCAPAPPHRHRRTSVAVFYHIHACGSIQRHLFYIKMLKSKALGNSYSWNANEVAKLGFLMTEVKGVNLVEINPESMAGLSARVIKEMNPENLLYITKLQKTYMNNKALNILAKKLKLYNESKRINSGSLRKNLVMLTTIANVLIVVIVR